MFCLALGLGLSMTIVNERSLYSKLQAIVRRQTSLATLKTQQAVYSLSHLYPTQRLITYPAVTAVEILDTSSTEAEAELLLYFSRSAWSNALNIDKDTTLESLEDRIRQSSLEKEYLLLTEEDSPLYEIWNEMLQSCAQIPASVQISTLDDPVETRECHQIAGLISYESDSESHAHSRIVSISSSASVTSQEGGEQSSSWSSSTSASLYSGEKDPSQIDYVSSFVDFSFDSLVLREHKPVDLFDWIYKSDNSFGSSSHLEYLEC